MAPLAIHRDIQWSVWCNGRRNGRRSRDEASCWTSGFHMHAHVTYLFCWFYPADPAGEDDTGAIPGCKMTPPEYPSDLAVEPCQSVYDTLNISTDFSTFLPQVGSQCVGVVDRLFV